MTELIVRDVFKTFTSTKALDGANFSARLGEMHAILGENGAGKSTLIKILSGSLQYDEGEIFFNEKKLRIKSPMDAIRAGIGTVYQELSLIKDLSVAENIFFNKVSERKFHLISRSDINKKTSLLFEKYGVVDIDPDTQVDQLSLSQQQMVEIVKILSREPKIIILDEATSALTDNKVEWLLSLAKKLASEGKLILFISHRLQEINSSCDRITVFRNGKDVGVCETKNTHNDELVSMMLGRRLSAYYPQKIKYATEQAVLEIKNVNVGKALRDANLKLRKGEVLGVGGLAGQGQLPLFQMLFGILAYHGEVLVHGKPHLLKNPGKCLELGIAMVPEDRATEGLVQTMTVMENMSLAGLKLFSKAGFIRRKREEEKVNQAIARFSIKASSKDARVMDLSGGNQQKVLLSKFLMLNPNIFLLYDSTRGVDVGTKAEIFSLVRKLAEEGNAILFYSTDIEELVNVCDRVVVMCNNTIAAVLNDEEISKENILKLSVGECI